MCLMCRHFLYSCVVPPFSPENLLVTSIEKDRISLAWQPAKETATIPVDGYLVEMTTGDADDFKQVGRVDGNTCHFDATGLQNGEKYNFRIRTQNPSGTSEGFAQLDSPVIAAPPCGEKHP